ncbi:MAG: pentapeptide repeat-containing protein [Pseudomonadota bacterium]
MSEKTVAELEKEWWDLWWEEDWSYNALDPKLQEYWAEDFANHPIRGPGGKRYTRAHTPLNWPEGTDAGRVDPPKSQWTDHQNNELAAYLSQRLEHHRGHSNPALFLGVVLLAVPSMPEAHVRDDIPTNKKPSSVTFDDAWLKTGTTWSLAMFGKAEFDGATFADRARFDDATFSGLVSFNGAIFSGSASFSGATFSAEAWFGAAKFSSSASFGATKFSGLAWFSGATFSGLAWFNNASFDPLDPSRPQMFFHDATFARDVAFRPNVFPNHPAYALGAFSGAKFERRARFDSQAFFAPAAFDGAILERGLRFYKGHIDPAGRATPEVMERQVAVAAGVRDAEQRDSLLQSIADGARILQRAMSDARHNDAEQLFHRLEVMARQARRKWSEPRRWLTTVYARTSDYGGSIGRPLLSTFIGGLLLAITFWIWEAKPAPDCRDTKPKCAWIAEFKHFEAAATFSGRNVFRPFYVWSVSPQADDSFDQKLLFTRTDDADGKQRIRPNFWVRFVSTVQSFFSVIMLFLTVLAARRYYQLS